jgi:hypothetical protein
MCQEETEGGTAIEICFKNGRQALTVCPAAMLKTIQQTLPGLAEIRKLDPGEESYDFVHGEMCEDVIFEPGKYFVVRDPVQETDELRICVAVLRVPYGQKTYRRILWEDGSYSDERKQPLTNIIRPLEGQNLWMFEALQAFRKVLGGKLDGMTIIAPGGDIIVVGKNVRIRDLEFRQRSTQTELTGRRKGPEAFVLAGQERIEVDEDKAWILQEQTKKRR